ncbi:DNA polymerase IV [Putridiphycobacter roseus]|uniref:DNA polymerase IV n=1 Tax=Putridiphycobacter roseus TaxID=2219161 RepID=A0A2W1N0T3_9FLAO|nr:DNA polymerase IV [Putridiphycobacter roseus]PZE16571.1 DNA polymerase IV [Putridiphycobacter roseus]
MELQGPFKKIIHVDMDAFYASVEQLDDESLRGKPIAVGGSEQRGVVAAASYEARKFGVRSAMSSVLAKKKCAELIFVKPRFERYKEVSQQIRAVFLEYSDLVEPLSLDEAFIDVTVNKKNMESANDIAKEIRAKIFERTGLTASAGISINKFTAKIASDINKPNGQKTIHPSQVLDFLEKLPIRKFFGVGEATAKKMNAWGIFNGRDLKQHTLPFLNQNFGKSGAHFYNIVRGIQHSTVKPDRVRKSVGAERTFEQNITSESFMLEKLNDIGIELEKRLIKSKNKGKTVTVKIKFSDFTTQTRSKTVNHFLQLKADFFPIIEELLYQEEIKKSVRLLGITISNLDHEEEQQSESIQLKFAFYR